MHVVHIGLRLSPQTLIMGVQYGALVYGGWRVTVWVLPGVGFEIARYPVREP